MSYNILAEGYDEPDWFKYADPRVLDFKYRSQKIITEIGESKADIICL